MNSIKKKFHQIFYKIQTIGILIYVIMKKKKKIEKKLFQKK